MNTQVPAADAPSGRPITGRTVLACFVCFFGVIFIANFFLVRAAVTSFGGVETESSYKAGLAFRQESEAAAAQEARHWKVDGHLGTERLDMTARDAEGRPVTGVTLLASLHHPTDRRHDLALDPREIAPGQWRADAQVPAGQWTLVVEFKRDDERLFRSSNRIIVK